MIFCTHIPSVETTADTFCVNQTLPVCSTIIYSNSLNKIHVIIYKHKVYKNKTCTFEVKKFNFVSISDVSLPAINLLDVRMLSNSSRPNYNSTHKTPYICTYSTYQNKVNVAKHNYGVV